MADAKKVKIGGIWYNVKDETARNELAGKVNKSGDIMTGSLIIDNNKFFSLIPSDTTKMGNATISIRNNEQLIFWHRNTDSTYQDLYLLPPISTSFSAKNNYYDILTSKNPVTVAQGGTGGTDSGWQALTAGSGVNSGTIKYRKIGSWVEIRGKDVKLKSTLTASYLTLLNVPSAIRPNEKVVLSSGFKVASSGVLEPAYCELTTSGNIDLCRPSVVSSITTNDLINFSAMYFV